MSGLTRNFQTWRFGAAAIAAAFGVVAWVAAPAPAEAQFLFGFGPRYYAPYPYYYPPPAYYPYYPPPAYYPAPAPAYYPPPAQAADPAAAAPPAPSAAAQITYTNRPAFTNAAGQPCREYTTSSNGGARQAPVYGTACRDADGQWRVAN